MNRPLHRLLGVSVAAALLVSACSTSAATTGPTGTTAASAPASSAATSPATSPASSGGKIAFLMPCSTCADRFEHQDKPDFINAVKALDPSIQVIANNAEGSSATQISQTEQALTNGAKVIVVSPLDEATGQAIESKAAAAGVPVISYDGLLTGAKVDFYVSFDTVKVGEMQGQYLVDHLQKGADLVMINGAQDIAPGRDFKKGAHEALDPAFKSGQLKLAYEADTPQFDPSKAQTEMDQALTKLGDNVQAVLSPNDGIAGGVIAALQSQKLAGKVLVTGQDATDAGLQRILLGQQAMTVYKPIPQEAQIAAQAAVGLVHGDSSAISKAAKTTVDNGAGSVPSVLLAPVVVTKANIADTVIKDGFTTWANVCKGVPASECPQH